jgi:hypothetical protein
LLMEVRFVHFSTSKVVAISFKVNPFPSNDKICRTVNSLGYPGGNKDSDSVIRLELGSGIGVMFDFARYFRTGCASHCKDQH